MICGVSCRDVARYVSSTINTSPANKNPLEGGRGATAPKGRNLHNRRSLTCGKHPSARLCLKGRTDVADGRLTTNSRLLYAVLPFRQFYVCVERRRSMTCGYENPAFQAANDAQTRRSFIIYGEARRASLQSRTHRSIGNAIACRDVARYVSSTTITSPANRKPLDGSRGALNNEITSPNQNGMGYQINRI